MDRWISATQLGRGSKDPSVKRYSHEPACTSSSHLIFRGVRTVKKKKGWGGGGMCDVSQSPFKVLSNSVTWGWVGSC